MKMWMSLHTEWPDDQCYCEIRGGKYKRQPVPKFQLSGLLMLNLSEIIFDTVDGDAPRSLVKWIGFGDKEKGSGRVYIRMPLTPPVAIGNSAGAISIKFGIGQLELPVRET